jgi:hypothetical protein
MGFILNIGSLSGIEGPRRNVPGFNFIKFAALLNIIAVILSVVMAFGGDGGTVYIILAIPAAVLGLVLSILILKAASSLQKIVSTGNSAGLINKITPMIIIVISALELGKALISFDDGALFGLLGILRAVGMVLIALVFMKFCGEYNTAVNDED